MAENQQQPENSDELSLVNLLENIFRFFRRYGILIALCAACGITLGYASFKRAPKLYASSLLLHSFTLANSEHINIIENWNSLLKSGEYDVLAQRLNCNPGMLKQVTTLSAEELQKLYISNNPNGFIVAVMVKDNAVLDSLERAIVYGLENSDYIKARLASKRFNLSQLIEKVNIEINKLDSSKKIIEATIRNNAQHSSSIIVDISNINTEMISLNEKLLDYQEQLKFVSAVQVFHKFEKFKYPAAPRFLKSIVLGFIGGFAFGYILAIVLYIRKRMLRSHA